MGKDRNKSQKEQKIMEENYSAPDVCKYFLISFCPHDLFPNTKQDLGSCLKRHDEKFKKQFESDGNHLIDSIVSGVDSKIKKTKIRIEQNQFTESDLPKEICDKIDQFDIEIKKLIFEAEKLGEHGKLEESELIMMEVEKVRSRKEDLIKIAESQNLNAKSLKVCEVCGALQAVNDTEQRILLHLSGKLHTGFDLLRKEADKLNNRVEVLKEALKNGRDPKRSDSRKNRHSRSKSNRRKRSRSQDKNRRDRKKHSDHRKSKYDR